MTDSMENIKKYIRQYVNRTDAFNKGVQPTFSERMEGHTGSDDMTEALRMRIHDPLWMLARQWQMGEFRGNDTGTAMSVECTVTDDEGMESPLEPAVESINPDMDILARIESAVEFTDRLRAAGVSGEKIKEFRRHALARYPLDWNQDRYALENESTREFEYRLNDAHTSYRRTYEGKIFDGCKLYDDCPAAGDIASLTGLSEEMAASLSRDYRTWFQKRYYPAQDTNPHWHVPDLNYSLEADSGKNKMVSNGYNGGRLSWYSMDYSGLPGKGKSVSRKELAFPSIVGFAAAPNRRLWQFEDRKVFMGNSLQQQSSGNAAMLKYVTMYSNDWMMIPLKVHMGSYVEVDNIRIMDTFGDITTISRKDRAGNKDVVGALAEKWQMYTCCNHADPSKTDLNGLYYAPQLVSTLEGKALEEVSFLRDEMSNMVWGVEEVIPDGCGSTLDAKLRATRLSEEVARIGRDNQPATQPDTVMFREGDTPQVKAGNDKAAYRYLLQSTVPFNWIPFVPQHVKDNDPFLLGGRETTLRRGKMPCQIRNSYGVERTAVRPLGSFLRQGLVSEGNKTIKENPLFINEEAVQATGIKMVKNHQRARWIKGASYNWTGYRKMISMTEAGSGLKFDVTEENK